MSDRERFPTYSFGFWYRVFAFIVTVAGYRRPRPDRSDCTRRPEPGLCSLTGLEAVLGRRASPSHLVLLTPLPYPNSLDV